MESQLNSYDKKLGRIVSKTTQLRHHVEFKQISWGPSQGLKIRRGLQQCGGYNLPPGWDRVNCLAKTAIDLLSHSQIFLQISITNAAKRSASKIYAIQDAKTKRKKLFWLIVFLFAKYHPVSVVPEPGGPGGPLAPPPPLFCRTVNPIRNGEGRLSPPITTGPPMFFTFRHH